MSTLRTVKSVSTLLEILDKEKNSSRVSAPTTSYVSTLLEILEYSVDGVCGAADESNVSTLLEILAVFGNIAPTRNRGRCFNPS